MGLHSPLHSPLSPRVGAPKQRRLHFFIMLLLLLLLLLQLLLAKLV